MIYLVINIGLITIVVEIIITCIEPEVYLIKRFSPWWEFSFNRSRKLEKQISESLSRPKSDKQNIKRSYEFVSVLINQTQIDSKILHEYLYMLFKLFPSGEIW